MGLGANSILQGWLLLEQRKKQAQQDRQAEEQQEIENIQVQKAHALAVKEQKRLQATTDLGLKATTRAAELKDLEGRLEAQQKQALGHTPSLGTFRIPEATPVAPGELPLGGYFEDYTGTRFGGTPETFDATGMVQHYGGNPYQSQEQSQQIREAAIAKINFGLAQKKAEAEVSGPVMAAEALAIERVKRQTETDQLKLDKEKRARDFAIKMKGRTEAQQKRMIIFRTKEEAANDPLNLRGDLTAATMGVSIGMGNSALPSGELGIRLLPLVRTGMIDEAVLAGFSREDAEKATWRPLDPSIKKKVGELAPLTVAIDGMRQAIAEGIAKNQFANNVWDGQIIKTIQEFKGFFGVSEYLIGLEKHHADAVAMARVTGESGRFSDQDMLMSLARMIRPGLLKGEVRARIELFERNARNSVQSILRGFHPMQQIVAFPDLIKSLGLNSETLAKLQGSQTDRTLEADSRLADLVKTTPEVLPPGYTYVIKTEGDKEIPGIKDSNGNFLPLP